MSVAATQSRAGSISKPHLRFWQIWNISFGFLGVQIGYSLQNANTSRILSAIGANPEHLSYFWLAAPLAGLIVQPIVGMSSDRTWTRLGRRIPFILGGCFVSALAMFFMPNSEHFATLIAPVFFGACMLLLMDTSFNVTMQPFRALVSDMVNDKQRNIGYSIQSFLINAGAVVGSILPFVLTWIGVANEPAQGAKVAPTVIWSFYFGGAALLLSVIWTSFRTKEYPPKEYALYHNMDEQEQTKKVSFITLVLNMPKRMIELSVTQFFSWFALFLMWVYTTNGITQNVWNVDPHELKFAQDVIAVKGTDSLTDAKLLVLKTDLEKSGTVADQRVNSDVVKSAQQIFSKEKSFPPQLCTLGSLRGMIAKFNDAGNWTGVIFAIYSIFAALFSLAITPLANRLGRKNVYMAALLCGGIGLFSMMFIHDKYALIVPMVGLGIAWAAILALPYAILSSSLPPKQTGVYMGIFNATITIPQIGAGVLGGILLSSFGGHSIYMLALAGASMFIAGVCAKLVIKENK